MSDNQQPKQPSLLERFQGALVRGLDAVRDSIAPPKAPSFENSSPSPMESPAIRWQRDFDAGKYDSGRITRSDKGWVVHESTGGHTPDQPFLTKTTPYTSAQDVVNHISSWRAPALVADRSEPGVRDDLVAEAAVAHGAATRTTAPIEQARMTPGLHAKKVSKDYYESFEVELGSSGQWEVLATQTSGEYSRKHFDRPMEASAYIADIRNVSPNVRNETSEVTSGRFVEAVVADSAAMKMPPLPNPDNLGVHFAVDAQKALAAGITNMKWDHARLSHSSPQYPLSVGLVAVDGAGNGRLIQAATTRETADAFISQIQTQPGLQYKIGLPPNS